MRRLGDGMLTKETLLFLGRSWQSLRGQSTKRFSSARVHHTKQNEEVEERKMYIYIYTYILHKKLRGFFFLPVK